MDNLNRGMPSMSRLKLLPLLALATMLVMPGVLPATAVTAELSYDAERVGRATPTKSVGTDLIAVQGVVSGRVTDGATGQPLGGTQVHIPTLNIGTVTDNNGTFTLSDVPAGEHTVHAQRLGYGTVTETVTVTAGQTARVLFELRERAVALEEIVVTGTAGGTERRAVGNVVSRIDAAAITDVAPVTDVQSLLNARAPGVVVQSGSGMVGGGSRMRIRGASSFSLNDQPLVYIDGVRMNNEISSGPAVQGFGASPTSRMSDIDPSDIESIEVIKGPAAATLYGTEASNGVIQIITKRGRSEEPEVNFRMRQGVNWFADAENRVPPNIWRDPSTGEIIEMNLVRQERERGTPIWTPGHLQGYGLTVSGGVGQVQYRLSANVDADNGIEPTNKLRRLNTRLNLNAPLSENLTLNGNIGVVRSRTDLATENAGTWFDTRMGHPQFLNTPQRGFWRRPPEASWNARTDFQRLTRVTPSATLEHNPRDWFVHRLNVGVDLTIEDNQTIIPRMDEELAQFYSSTAALGEKSTSARHLAATTVDYGATVNLPVTATIGSSTSFGFQYYRNHTQVISAFGREFPAFGLETVGAAADPTGSENYWHNTTVGLYGQQQFSYDDRLFATVGLRVDDNDAFGEDFDIVTYPKASASWVVSEEAFWDVDWFNVFRLRTAWGATGQQPETFAALRTFAPITTGSGEGAVTPDDIGNPDLAPERGEELELGFEANLFDDRVRTDFTFYRQNTRDAILLRQQAPSLGFPSAQFVNVGAIRNTGYEAQLGITPYDSEQTRVDLNFNLSRNSNEVVDLGGEEFIDLGSSQQHRVGYPVAGWWERKAVSAVLDQNGIATDVMCDGGPDVDHQPVPCDDAPKVFLGHSHPTIEGSFGPTISILGGQVSIHGMVDFKMGHKKDDSNRMARCVTRQICPENVWPENYDPVIQAEIQDPDLFPANVRIHKSDFARLREISVNFLLPDRWAQHLGARRASFNVGARNLYTFTKWTGLDPEAFRSDQLHLRAEQEAMPQLTRIETTLNVTF